MTAIWTAQEAAKATGGKAIAHWQVSGVVIDSRQAGPDDLFIALKGENTDGHHFVKSALEKGAVAMVSHIPEGVNENAPLLVVRDPFQALCDLAAFNRRRTQAKIIAVTGSVGKTSTKEALYTAFSALGPVYATSGNYNNHLGVPISLTRMDPRSDFAIFELGMNHAGEIALLSPQVRPHVAIITNVEAVHLEFFDSVEGIADAKAEIFLGLDSQGTAILNHDNPHYERLRRAAEKQGINHILSFGTESNADCRLLDYRQEEAGSFVKADIAGQVISYSLGTLGLHHARNSLSVLAAVHALGQDIEQAAHALKNFGAPEGRGKRSQLTLKGKDFTLIDDSYNASPSSVKAALAVLGSIPHGRKLAILGDMRELGKDAPSLHQGLAADIALNRIDSVITVGEHMQQLYNALPGKVRERHYPNIEALIAAIETHIQPGDIVLIKGSHGVRMFRLVEFLKAV